MKKYIAEMIGTMVLVLMGCGSAVFAGSVTGTVGAGVGTVGVALAFGLSVVAMAYAIGGISGCHINPAITLGVFLTGRMNGKDAGMYMIFQVIGAIIGSAVLFALVSTGAHDGPTATGSNGFGEGEMLQAFIAEAVFTFIFVLVVLGSTDPKKGAGNLAGLAIGLSLVLVHIVCIPITGTSVNPARSIAPALFQGGEQVEAREGAAGALAGAALQMDHEAGGGVFFTETGGYDAHHALMPFLAGKHQRVPFLRPQPLDLGDGSGQCFLLISGGSSGVCTVVFLCCCHKIPSSFSKIRFKCV